jgi:hypothetical protein
MEMDIDTSMDIDMEMDVKMDMDIDIHVPIRLSDWEDLEEIHNSK